MYNWRNNSNSRAYCCRITSNALKYGLRTNSNALMYNWRSNSNALQYLWRQNSNALMYNWRSNSNALMYNWRSNSNALQYYWRSTSNAYNYYHRVNSNAIVGITEETDTFIIDTEIGGPTYTLVFDLWISQDDQMHFSGNTVFNGNGHFIQLADGKPNVIKIDAGVTVTFQNVVFKDFSDTVFQLGAGAQVVFGSGTVIELLRSETMTMNWVFTGDSFIKGCCNILDLGNYAIQVSSSSTLIIHGIWLAGLIGTNLQASSLSQITLWGAHLLLAGDFNFNTGKLRFEKEVEISGRSTFTYASTEVSTIASSAMLKINNGVTFSYTSTNRDLLAMADITAGLFLNGCTLAAPTGIRLTKGTLFVDHKNMLTNASAASTAQGISLGNGVASGDLNIEMLPGGSLDLQSGFLNYENVS